MKNDGEYDQKTLLHELIQGRELVKQLRSHLDKSSSTGELLIDMILSSFDKVISMSTNKSVSDLQTAGPSESLRSKSGSRRSDHDSDLNDIFKRRKTLPRWTKRVGVGPSNNTGIEGPLDDGYSWRKYGQKDILGATYPRGYYRCTYRHTQGCLATKHVQRSSNPTIFDVTHRGKHTCQQVSYPVPVSHLRYKQFQNQNQNQDQQELQKLKQSQEVLLLDFEKGLKIKNEDLHVHSTKEPSSSFAFASTSMPPTECIKTESHNFLSSPEPYFVSSCHEQRNDIGDAFNVNISEHDHLTADQIISAGALTSAMNSTIIDMDFDLDPANFDRNIRFDYLDFFN